MLLIGYVLSIVTLFIMGLGMEVAPTWVTALLMGLLLMGPLWLVNWHEE